MKKLKLSKIMIGLAIFASSNAMATVLTGGLNVDNGYAAFISTDDNIQGTQISAGNHWPSTYALSATTLDAGQDYFLHVYAYDQGWIAGFLGEFDLAGNDHTFSNGQSNLTTNAFDWGVSTTGWDSSMSLT